MNQKNLFFILLNNFFLKCATNYKLHYNEVWDFGWFLKVIYATLKKDLHDQDHHDGVITHLEPDILDCEVKWALESITMSKDSGSDGIPVELFQILKADAVKVPHSICQQIWKTQQ